MKERLQKLYKTVIVRHNKEPFHFEKQEDWPGKTLEANNPLCGDRFQLYLRVEEDKVTEAYFHGFGCAISKASTSVLTERLVGLTLEEVQMMCRKFLQFVDGQHREETTEEAIAAFAAVDEFPERKECVILAWKALEGSLRGE